MAASSAGSMTSSSRSNGSPPVKRLHRLDDVVGRLFAVGEDDLPGDFETLVLIGLQRRRRIVDLHEQPRQRLRVQDGVRAAIAAAWIHRMCRVPQQRDPAESPSVHGVAVKHRVFEDELRPGDHLRNIEPVEFPVREGRDEVLDPSRRRPIVRFVVVARLLGHPVDELGTVVESPDRIDHHLAARHGAHARNAGAGEEGRSPRDSAPHVDPAEMRRAFVRMELAAHRGMKAVRPHENRAAHRLGVFEQRLRAARVLFDADAAVTETHRVRSQPALDRVGQDLVQVGAMDGEMRVFVAGEAAAGLGEDGLAVPVEIGEFARLDAIALQGRLEAQRGQLPDRVRQHVDADAERPELRRGFVHPTGQAPGMKRQRQGKAADSAPDDEYVRLFAGHRTTMSVPCVAVNDTGAR